MSFLKGLLENLKRLAPRASCAAWECKVNDRWLPYDEKISGLLEANFRSRTPVQFQRSEHEYQVDFQRMQQKNRKYGTTRPIRRRRGTGISPPPPQFPPPPPPVSHASPPPHPGKRFRRACPLSRPRLPAKETLAHVAFVMIGLFLLSSIALASFSRARNPSASQITSMSTSQLKGILKSAGKSAIGIVDRTELVSRVIAVSNPGFLWSVGAAALDIVWGVTSTLCACLSAIGGGVIPAFLRGVWYCLAGIGTLLSYACAGMYGLLCYLASQGTVLSHACAGIYGLLYRVVYTPLVWLAHLLTTLAKLAYASATWILQAAWTVRLLPWLSYIGIEIKLHPRLQFLESVFFALGVIWLSRSATRSWLRRLVAAPGSTGIGELNSEWSTAGEDVGNECVRRELEHSHTSTRESMEYNIAYAQFKKRMPSREPSRICRYDSKPVAEVFASKRAAMKRAGKSVEERWVFHGTDLGNVSSIMRGGFKIGGRDDVKVANGSSYGTGVYSSHTPTAPLKYGKGKCVILAKALIGRNDSRNWGGSVDVDKYDSWSPVHDWVIFKEAAQLHPLYVLYF